MIAAHIQEFGWHCLHVESNVPEQTAFSYSIGFSESFDQPEVLVFGLAQEKAHALLAECAHVFREGGSIEVDTPDDRILSGGYEVVFRPLRSNHYAEYVGSARRYYGARPFSAVVLFLPDAEHRFPWDPDYDYINADEALSIV
jgi:hypothetical protein